MKTATLTMLVGLGMVLSVTVAEASDQVYYFHNDHLGTPQAMSDAAGRIVWTAEYDPFGKASVNQDPDGDGQFVVNNLRFPGQYYDAETGLHYNYHRDYDPSTGRYLQPDPIGLLGGLNPYRYALDNPVVWIDPFGLEVRAQWHSVLNTSAFHTLVRITPDNQARYTNDPRFSNLDERGHRYATLGAGPEGGLLVSNINRESDRAPHQGGIVINRPNKCGNEDAYIDRLFSLDANYGDNLDYDAYAANPENRRWWVADDGFNSNSYLSGLLRASGVQPPAIPVNAPGWGRPVPVSNFQPRP